MANLVQREQQQQQQMMEYEEVKDDMATRYGIQANLPSYMVQHVEPMVMQQKYRAEVDQLIAETPYTQMASRYEGFDELVYHFDQQDAMEREMHRMWMADREQQHEMFLRSAEQQRLPFDPSADDVDWHSMDRRTANRRRKFSTFFEDEAQESDGGAAMSDIF